MTQISDRLIQRLWDDFWFGFTIFCFADTGASRSTSARNKLLCDDADDVAVVVAVAVFCLRRCCCWKGVGLKNIRYLKLQSFVFLFVCRMLPLLWRKCSTKCCQQSLGAPWPPIQNSELACRIPGASGAKAILPRYPNLCFG